MTNQGCKECGDRMVKDGPNQDAGFCSGACLHKNVDREVSARPKPTAEEIERIEREEEEIKKFYRGMNFGY